MSDSERTSAMNGVPTMTSPVSSRVVGGHLEGDLGGGFSVGVESYYRNWNVTGTMVSGGMAMLASRCRTSTHTGLGLIVAYRHAFTRKLLLTERRPLRLRIEPPSEFQATARIFTTSITATAILRPRTVTGRATPASAMLRFPVSRFSPASGATGAFPTRRSAFSLAPAHPA